jgi:hypothetical protein
VNLSRACPAAVVLREIAVLALAKVYQARSRPANSEDDILCDFFASHAAHAMAGKTGFGIGSLHDRFIHVPIELLATHKKHLDPKSAWWRSVLATTGQPEKFTSKRRSERKKHWQRILTNTLAS